MKVPGSIAGPGGGFHSYLRYSFLFSCIDLKLFKIQFIMKFNMKNYDYLMIKKSRTCFSLLAISFVLHFSIIMIFYNEIVNPGNDLISVAKGKVIFWISYIGPLLFAMSGLKISWSTYEKYSHSTIYNLYLILLALNIGIIFLIDKFLFYII